MKQGREMKKYIVVLVGGALFIATGVMTPLHATQTPQKKGKPFLIQGKLPHLTMLVKQLWDDEDLALTPQQKKQLLHIRKETLSKVQSLAPKIVALEEKIVQASNDAVEPLKLQKDVEQLASLRAEATMAHLRCLYNTRKVLTKEQLYILE
jgi:Spy/CpxP family protein refolding chaperone